MDNIDIKVNGEVEVIEAVKKYEEIIKEETLGLSISYTDEELDKQNINGHETGIAVIKRV